MSRKIKSIKRYNQNYKNFNFSDLTSHADEEFLEMTIQLNDTGSPTEEIKYTPDGSIEEKNTYEFDANGKLLSHTLLYVVDEMTEKRVLSRNEKGFLLSEVKYYGTDPGEKTAYEHDEKDNISAIIHFDEEGEFISREEIKYNENGSISERCTLDRDKKVLTKITFVSVDKETIEENEFDGKEALVAKTVIKFNDKGKELTTVQTNPQGKLISSIKNVYDERGNIIEKIFKDFYSKRVKYEYNDKDLLIVQELYDENGMLLRKNIYDYDEEGNVIAEQNYEMDTTRGGRDKHFGTRYEYEFF